MQYVLLSMLAGALLGGGLAIAQTETQAEAKPRYLSKFDEQFKTADKDGDGSLTRSEAEAGNLSRIVEKFDRLDANQDGKVSREEIRFLVRNRLSS